MRNESIPKVETKSAPYVGAQYAETAALEIVFHDDRSEVEEPLPIEYHAEYRSIQVARSRKGVPSFSTVPETALRLWKEGRKLRDIGNLVEAISKFEGAISIASDFFEAHLNLGNAYFYNGQISEAERFFSRIILLSDHINNSEVLCAKASAALGDLYLEQALNAGAGSLRDMFANLSDRAHGNAINFYGDEGLPELKADLYYTWAVALTILDQDEQALRYVELADELDAEAADSDPDHKIGQLRSHKISKYPTLRNLIGLKTSS